MIAQGDYRRGFILKLASRVIGACAVAMGLVVLLGWCLDAVALKSIVPAWPAMKPDTALSFVLLGAALWALQSEKPGPWRKTVVIVAACLVALLSAVTISEYVFHWNPQINHRLFPKAGSGAALFPGWMAPATSFALLALSLSVFWLDASNERLSKAAQFFAFVGSLTGLISLLGYVYGVSFFRGIGFHRTMAVHTALMLLLVGPAILSARPSRGLAGIAVSNGPGGLVMRRLLPLLVGLTVVGALLALEGERVGLYDGIMGMALFSVLMVVILVVLVSSTSGSLQRLESKIRDMLTLEQERVEELSAQSEELTAANEELATINEELIAARSEAERRAAEMESFVSSMADGIMLLDTEGNVVFINQAGRDILGSPEEESFEKWETRCTRCTVNGDPLPYEEMVLVRALNGETVKDTRYRWITPWGRDVILNLSAAPVRDAHGTTIGATQIFRDQSERVDFERRNEELYKREHHIADVLQEALIPQATYDMPGCRITVRYEPALKEAEVGGDFCDVFDLGGGKFAVLIGDVAGKGLPAAIQVAAVRHAIRSYAYIDPSPGRVLTLANESLCKDAEGMLTAFFAVVDVGSGLIAYACGGHEPPFIRTAVGDVEELEIAGRPLGIMGGFSYGEAARNLVPGDTLIMFTDGITEARTESLRFFGREGIRRYLAANLDSPSEELASGLLEAAKRHAGGPLHDDAAILALELEPVKERLRQEITVDIADTAGLSASREFTESAAKAVGFQGDDLWAVVTSVFEACVNAATHGQPTDNGEVILRLSAYSDRLEAVIKDSGKGFICPSDTPIPPATSPRGRGIPLMRKMMDEVRFETGNGCTVTLVKKLPVNPS